MTTFTAHRTATSGWIVACHVAGYGNTKIASFGHDQYRAEALAMDLNSTLASHLGHAAAMAGSDHDLAPARAFRRSDAAQAFIESANDRETAREIMEAIIAFSASLEEAETIWADGIGNWDAQSKLYFVNAVTGDGRRDPEDFCWGASGSDWAKEDL